MRVVRKKLERKCTQFGETHVMAFTENIEIQWQWQLPNERNLTMIISIYEETSMLRSTIKQKQKTHISEFQSPKKQSFQNYDLKFLQPGTCMSGCPSGTC